MPSLDHPYRDLTGGQWLRGNLHTHTTRSDGSRPPQAVIDDYAERGFGFLMLSDHDVYTSEADYRQNNARGMVLIPGNEISRNGPHLQHVDADRFVPPTAARQQVISDIVAAHRETGRGFAVVNHPNWQAQFDHCTIDQMREWIGYIGMEIYNGVINRLDGSPYATDKWDMLLSEGRRLWGFANDDSHAATGDVELGWNVAYVRDRSAAGVVEALRAGRFYCSTGVTITAINVEGARVRIETKDAQRIAAFQNIGKRFAVVEGASIEVEAPRGASYIRFECFGAGERMAWTQPFFVDETAAGEGPQASRFIAQWRVSSLVEGLRLEQASPRHAAEVSSAVVASQRSNDQGMQGFVDARAQIQGQAGVVYLTTEIQSDTERRATLFLGYDGPIRIWLNDQPIFDGPGVNPAVPDRLQLHAALQRGKNRLVVALDSNGGKAWGIFGRIE